MCSTKYKKIYLSLFVSLTLVGCNFSDDVSEPYQNKRGVQSPLSVTEINKPSKKEIDVWMQKHVYKLEQIESQHIDYMYNSVDLNNDGKLETFVLVQDVYFCGSGGCSSYLFDEKGEMIGNMTVVDEPIFVSKDASNGWKNIIVRSGGNYHALEFDGNSYPLNPSLQPIVERKEKEAQKLVIATSIYQQNGYELEDVYPEEILMPFEEYIYTFKNYDDPLKSYKATVNLDRNTVDLTTQ